MPDISVAVIVPTYNRAAHVGAAIDSILAQAEPPDEIIVVDDGSTDATHDVLARYGDAIKVLYQQNAGASAARNAGARVATSDWLTFLDSDDLWNPDRMRLLREDLSSAGSDVVAHVGNVLFCGVGEERDFFSVARIGIGPGSVQRVARPLALFLHGFFLIGAAFRRDDFVALGGFDTSFPVDEDTEMAHRLAERGEFLVRGDVLAKVIRQAGDDVALSKLRRRDPFLANDLKQRQFTAIIERSEDPHDRKLAAAALSSALIQRAILLRECGKPGYWPTLWNAFRVHPSLLKGFGRVLLAVTNMSRQPTSVDRTT